MHRLDEDEWQAFIRQYPAYAVRGNEWWQEDQHNYKVVIASGLGSGGVIRIARDLDTDEFVILKKVRDKNINPQKLADAISAAKAFQCFIKKYFITFACST